MNLIDQLDDFDLRILRNLQATPTSPWRSSASGSAFRTRPAGDA